MLALDNNLWLFDIFAGLALLAAGTVIFAKNPVRAVLSLILTFFATAVTWLLLGAEFLAIALVLVYVGAVMVLFLFVVMMLDINFAALRARFTKWLSIGLLLTAITVTLMLHLMQISSFMHPQNKISTVAELGELIFTKYLLQFEIAGVVLLVAIIAAIGLIYRGPRDRKQQNISQQIQATPAQRLRLVDGD